MMGSPVNKDADHIVPQIPPGTVGAEIGVWMGNTSMKFLNRQLKHLHLVDSWAIEPYEQQVNSEHGSYQNYLKKYSRITGSTDPKAFQDYYENVYLSVKLKFADKLNVTIHRMTSTKFFDTVGEQLDWVYVDGDHSYEGCLADLKDSLKVVKPGGIVFGDDYQWPGQPNGKPGVTRAVDEFLAANPTFTIKKHGKIQFEIRT